MAGELPFPKNERNIVEIRQDIYIREMVKQNAKRIIRCPKDYQENHFYPTVLVFHTSLDKELRLLIFFSDLK